MKKISIKTVYFHLFKKINKNQQKNLTDWPYLFLFRPLPETNLFFLGLSKMINSNETDSETKWQTLESITDLETKWQTQVKQNCDSNKRNVLIKTLLLGVILSVIQSVCNGHILHSYLSDIKCVNTIMQNNVKSMKNGN